MLSLVGLGICGDITNEGAQEIESAKEIYYEPYTLVYPNNIHKKIVNRYAPKELKRSDVESKYLIKRAKENNIVLLVGGDPLIATTHITLILECINSKVPYKIIHNSSIYGTAIGKSGLHVYKFGKTATLVNPRKNYKPTSSIKIIEGNLKNNMHTLVLLDTEPRPMDAKTAIKLLLNFEHLVVISQAGCENEKIHYGKPKNLLEHVDELGEPPITMIVPSKLHFLEKEFLDNFSV